MPPRPSSATHCCSPSVVCPHGQTWPSSQACQLLPTWHPLQCWLAGTLECGWGGEVACGSQQALYVLFMSAGLAGWGGGLGCPSWFLSSCPHCPLCFSPLLLYVRLSLSLPRSASIIASHVSVLMHSPLHLCVSVLIFLLLWVSNFLSLLGCLDLSLSVSHRTSF